MNREILFRGKREGEWFYGDLTTGEDTAQIWYKEEGYGKVNVLVDISTVGQYTGLTDRNGVKIFEGDIVHYQYEPGEGYWNFDQKSVIEWESTGFYMEGIMGTNKYALSCGWLESIPHNDGGFFEVIGNIHDNPEMLGEEENV